MNKRRQNLRKKVLLSSSLVFLVALLLSIYLPSTFAMPNKKGMAYDYNLGGIL